MSTTLGRGWLKDKAGKRFAPKTLASLVYTSDNQSLETRIDAEHDEMVSAINSVAEELATKILNYTEYSVVLKAADWKNNEAPYEITISLTPVKADTDLQILPDYNMSEEQVLSWMDAKIISGKTFDTYFKLKAYGDKPKIDLPISALIGSNIFIKVEYYGSKNCITSF